MKYLIIGGVAGGASAAARLRRLDEKAQIILFEKGNYVSYANCGLPYYIGGTIADRAKLFVQTAKGFHDRFNIDIRTEQEVIALHPDKKSISVKELSSGNVYEESYDKLVLSPGAEPIKPNLPGINDERIFTLRNVSDTDKIKMYINGHQPKKAVVIGGGFIGLEMAENLHNTGAEVTVVEMSNQVMAPIDFSMAQIVHHHLVCKGVNLILNDGVKSFTEQGDLLTVDLQSGKSVQADFVLLSIGVRPDIALAEKAGLEIGKLHGIAVNEHLQTSNPDIYAIGDAIEVVHGVTGMAAKIALAGPANKQGRIAADNIVEGNKEKYEGTIGTSVAKVFDLTVASSGANAKMLKSANIPYVSSWTHPASHAGYYPGALNMDIKILFSPENGRLFGAQIVGYDGVDKRIEMAAQVIQKRGTVYDLAKLEHAYAPPFSSAKDPMNMAGFVAENILEHKVETVTWRDIETLPKDAVCVDVRTPVEYGLGTIPGFKNVPVDELRSRMSELPKDKMIVVTCAVGLRGYLAYRILTQNGFTNVKNLSGGYKTWEAATEPVGDAKNGSANCKFEPADKKSEKVLVLDACGLMCPGPIMKLKEAYEKMAEGETLIIKATDPAFERDVQAWCKVVGAKLNYARTEGGIVNASVTKEKQQQATPEYHCSMEGKNKTLIVFSDDLDKALASFVLANGAAATGKKVTMFFTFWGLNVIKKSNKPRVKKDIFGKMFGFMLPANSKELGLSKMNMFGLGSIMMRHIMKLRRIDNLESLRQQAIDNGVEMIACTMSMDVMGVAKEELLDNVVLGGVASYMERAEQAGVNLFI
ncbi:MAG: FAD-dependent oxidoreductase [Bacteroidales bacterium]|jgi:NADPH-dependent 2,4-dienoyl-CoA reductase/sulfur reductase-like enzyme/peroxiredoxin family protein/rhodanese-related sulfurtransferase/TusA-related sulfurtransferase|nr:FAD-dependent oxidoreductase [Bacteroidales bacterium]MCI1732771.1 FAD-dependent oxidoreductase [Bacteroidales bacterium]